VINVLLGTKKIFVRKKPKPMHEWQTGDFQRQTEFRVTIPNQFLLLCKLMNVTPHQLVIDFMDNLSCGSWKREGRDDIKVRLIEYFIEHGYGQQHYSEKEIRMIFKEMDAIGMLYPINASQEFINEHTRWRENFHTWWFKKWFGKNNRTI
jgi:hypothetical protein